MCVLSCLACCKAWLCTAHPGVLFVCCLCVTGGKRGGGGRCYGVHNLNDGGERKE